MLLLLLWEAAVRSDADLRLYPRRSHPTGGHRRRARGLLRRLLRPH